MFGVWYGQELGAEQELRLLGTPRRGTGDVGLLALHAGVSMSGVFHNLHSFFLSTRKIWASGTSE